MYLIQILLPQYNNEGRLIDPQKFQNVKQKLTETFGGVTSNIRAPADRFWKDEDNKL
ncbi:MAG: hypothetical protein M3512_07740 [Bacteroidota bacterium]|nr:hypothetical protein [Bacteroidota bacterium]